MNDLFTHAWKDRLKNEAPLAARMRSRTLAEFVGQEEIIGPSRLLYRAIETDRLFSSIILWGPPGTGKTTLAHIIANKTKSNFVTLSAVMVGKEELRRVIEFATEQQKFYQKKTILFVDEVHRWNKAQQDALLPHVENGTITLIGATTENPYFEVIGALVSRSRIFQLHPLSDHDIRLILERTLVDKERGFGERSIMIDEDALQHLIRVAGGDARNALNALELAVESTQPGAIGQIHISLEVAQESIQRRAVLYDKDGDAHYDTISAFIKSVRGSDPDAALYWLAKMLYAGEDPRFILRRLIILAGEDIGLADPNGLLIATAAAQAFDYIGLPEGIYPIVEATLYLSTAPKSNSAGSYFKAFQLIEEEGVGAVPNICKTQTATLKRWDMVLGTSIPMNPLIIFYPSNICLLPCSAPIFIKALRVDMNQVSLSDSARWRKAQREALGIETPHEIPELSHEEIAILKGRHKVTGN